MLIVSAFFFAFLFGPLTHAKNQPHCPEFVASENAVIRYVHDGDTLFLQDKRKLRLIGIDTPELNSSYHKNGTRQTQPAQPFAIPARDFVRDLIRQHGRRVQLMPGTEPADHYGRQLFHIQLADGSLLQARLLQAGFAIAYSTPPNHKLSHCYHNHEQQARNQRSNIWSHPNYQITPVSRISPDLKGFQRIRGRVRHIGESKKALWINFYGHFSVRIDKHDLQYFVTPLQQLLEKEITVRGWLHHYKNKSQISIRHPSSIEAE
ncbi:MAG: thermonuclease family protein [Gammaproteobacteria bacterium]|nr:thermonuclease family protein [Gammaproteobacteria bacterium]